MSSGAPGPMPPDPATPGVDWLGVGRQILQSQPFSWARN